MKRIFVAAALVASASAFAGDVGVSIGVGQPGFHGRIDIGNAPPPQLIYTQPVVVEPIPANATPVYLYVPPYEAKNWHRYCHKYAACAAPVYFVQQEWYENVYAPRVRHAAQPMAQVFYAHDIHGDVVRANVIRAHDVHAENVHARVVYRARGDDSKEGEDVDARAVSASEIVAHDIHARVVEADTLYVHDLHTGR
ncbi:hypothetical protein DIE15_35630 [Burkholderia sp. Bp9031]|uniref:hypothetical protein n=1 Tax=Burkholderia sp. Bp9031 TaxID=2184566 RepID=UPI000F5DF39D|nr:hypothetical protein [Burkholderia sp. Bp9031]RQZ05680.1 hypothetical protein DIE15_35630 [Burkholderia sp. Bp9031]